MGASEELGHESADLECFERGPVRQVSGEEIAESVLQALEAGVNADPVYVDRATTAIAVNRALMDSGAFKTRSSFETGLDEDDDGKFALAGVGSGPEFDQPNWK